MSFIHSFVSILLLLLCPSHLLMLLSFLGLDEYTLPKIAERDLRRFANLRSTSSELGVNLPLQKVVMKIPMIKYICLNNIERSLFYFLNVMHNVITSFTLILLSKHDCWKYANTLFSQFVLSWGCVLWCWYANLSLHLPSVILYTTS
jgi:hypothetical protein